MVSSLISWLGETECCGLWVYSGRWPSNEDALVDDAQVAVRTHVCLEHTRIPVREM
jgi:hypothetical protein